MKVREVIQILEREGWRLDRQRGSHRQFRHPDRPCTVTVAGQPGCVAVGSTQDEVERLVAEAIPLHIESLQEHGDPVPAPVATGSTKVRVA